MIELGLSLTNAISGLMGGASILALFASGEVGVWFEPNDITTLYQDINGTTPVTTPGQTVGLMLDKSKGLVPGPELVTGPWTLSTAGGTSTATESPSGTLNLTGDGTNQARADYSFPSALGKTYRITCTVSGAIASTVVGPSQGSNLIVNSIALALGVNSYVFTATTATTWFRFFKSAATLSVISNISIKELPGYHAVQTTAAQRPTYGVIPYGGVRNFANGSGAVGDAAYWPASVVQNGVTATKTSSGIDTDGLPYVVLRYQGTATGTQHGTAMTQSASLFPALAGQTFTGSMIASFVGGSMANITGIRVDVVEQNSGGTFLANTGSSYATTGAETILVATRTLTDATTAFARTGVICVFTSGATIDVSFKVKAVQFEKAAARSAFQLNLSKYNVTEAGKASLGVLYPDGIDDWMVTPSINFTGTDKVSTWVGVDKMINNAQSIVFELSADTNANSGVFNSQIPLGAGQPLRFVSRGTVTSLADMTSALYSAPSAVVAYGSGDISGDNALLFANNVQVAQSVTDQGTGNYGNYPLYLFRRGAGALFFGSIFTGLIVRGAASLAAQISNTNAFMNSELGAY